jgi:hypothetical protein
MKRKCECCEVDGLPIGVFDPLYIKTAKLEERVARIIDPKFWDFFDEHWRDDPPHPGIATGSKKSLEKARRAIEEMKPWPS